MLVAGGALAAAIRGEDKPAAVSQDADTALATTQSEGQPTVVYRAAGQRGQVDIAELKPAPGAPMRSAMKCDRVYFAAGRGICLARGGGFAAGYQAQLFDSRLRVRHRVSLQGVPSRARVSPDGRYGAVTLFVTGHAYAAAGSFSTATTLIDLTTGTKIAGLEDFTVFKGSRQVNAVDVNFWGVTFARDSDVFYATLATGGKTYLIRGSVKAKTARVLHENVECPSLSPDGTRIAYKSRTGSKKNPWRLTVLDLSDDAGDAALRDAVRRRPGGVARRRPRPLRPRRGDLGGRGRWHGHAAPLHRGCRLARGRTPVLSSSPLHQRPKG